MIIILNSLQVTIKIATTVNIDFYNLWKQNDLKNHWIDFAQKQFSIPPSHFIIIFYHLNIH